jgi:Asp/Glu/hydantoin racemase
MTRLAVLHTVPFLVDRFKALLNERYPKLDHFHMLDESLLQDLLRGKAIDAIVPRVETLAGAAKAAGADVILFTCSSTSPAVDEVRKRLDKPLLKIDDAMAEKAVQSGTRIAVLCTASSTVGPSTAIIKEHATKQERQVEVHGELCADAYKALMAGDRPGHDRLLVEAARRLAKEHDVIVLAQASMAHLAKPLGIELQKPVLASPDLCLDALKAYVGDAARA